MVCPTILFGEAYAALQPTKRFYSYRLTQPLSVPYLGCEPSLGVCHVGDLLYLFGAPIALRGVLYSEDEYQLSRDMIRAWANFAKVGNPGRMGSVQWEEAFERNAAAAPETSYMELNVKSYRMHRGFYRATCDSFWKPKIFA